MGPDKQVLRHHMLGGGGWGLQVLVGVLPGCRQAPCMESLFFRGWNELILRAADSLHYSLTVGPPGLPWWLRGQSVCLQCGRPRFDPWVRKILWRRKRPPTPVLLPGNSHGRRTLVGYSPWGRKELDTTERIHFISLQPSYALWPSSLFSFSLSQSHGLFQWVGFLHQVANVLELQLQHQSSNDFDFL